jgi:hypothetical protein
MRISGGRPLNTRLSNDRALGKSNVQNAHGWLRAPGTPVGTIPFAADLVPS